MKTLVVILGLVLGTAAGMNMQAQSQTKTQGSSTSKSQPAVQSTQTPSQTKSMIKITDLEKPIQDNLSSQFKGWTPTQAYRLDSKGVLSYEVLVKKESNEMRIFYDNTGKYLKEEPVAAMTHNTTKSSSSMKHTTQTAPAQKPTTKPR